MEAWFKRFLAGRFFWIKALGIAAASLLAIWLLYLLVFSLLLHVFEQVL